MAKGYCSTSDVGNYLGVTLTSAQQTYATSLIEAAEAYIDRETRKGWLLGPISAERYDLREPVIYLRSHPVSAVTSITTRTTQVGDTPVTLVAGTDYELLDADLGEVRFASGYGDREPGYWSATGFRNSVGGSVLALISYTPNLPVPADISRATTMIAGQSMLSNIYPDRIQVSKVQIDQATSVTYSGDGVTLQIPLDAQHIIDGYCMPLFA